MRDAVRDDNFTRVIGKRQPFAIRQQRQNSRTDISVPEVLNSQTQYFDRKANRHNRSDVRSSLDQLIRNQRRPGTHIDYRAGRNSLTRELQQSLNKGVVYRRMIHRIIVNGFINRIHNFGTSVRSSNMRLQSVSWILRRTPRQRYGITADENTEFAVG